MTDNNSIQSIRRIQEIINLQDTLNETTTTDWKKSDNKYMRAAWTEAAEGINHLGWEWWKNSDVDIPQFRMELIDMLHFLISQAIKSNFGAEGILKSYEIALDMHELSGNTLASKNNADLIEELVKEMFCGSLPRVFVVLFYMFQRNDMFLIDIYRMYIGKNVLNNFRRDNGYMDKTYIKIWNGEEDNVYLTNFVETCPEDLKDGYFKDYIETQLTNFYEGVVKPQSEVSLLGKIREIIGRWVGA